MRIAKEGVPVLAVMIVPAVASTAAIWFISPGLARVSTLVWLALLAWGVWFFRDPDRITPPGDDLVISPADGRVIKVDRAPLPPEIRGAAGAMGLAGSDAPMDRVSIFLNLFNVHVNRVPATGKIVKLAYVPGKFFNASLDKASIHNERSIALMVDTKGRAVGFVQIAGLVARRIVNHLSEGQSVRAGERFGLIRFGSRAEIFFPPGSVIRVKAGDSVVAGESVLGELPPVVQTRSAQAPAPAAAGSGA